AAVTDIYGLHNKPFTHDFTVRPLEEYSGITFNITGLPDSTAAFVQLLGSNDQPAYVAPVGPGHAAVFRHLNPSTYYARLIVDRNANGRWDTGIADSIQPEDVYYFAKALKLRKNWDVNQDWDINELPVDMQKPLAIKKNKPKLKPGEKARRDDDEEEEDDEFGGNAFINNRRGGAMGNFGRGGTTGLQGGANNGLRR
ncbi:MAG: hypothetical protein K2F72_07145, partial [Muribaculaceae bacterium]|nr:hypothetical protein [Muribaculaceae bacterium]